MKIRIFVENFKVIRVEAKRKLCNENLLPAKDKLNTIKLRMASAAESREAKIGALQERLREHVLIYLIRYNPIRIQRF